AEMPFRALEVRHHVAPRPVAVAKRLPEVVVALLAAHVDHRVDGRAAAQHLAARISERAAVQSGLGDCLEAPIGSRVADRVEVAARDVDHEPVVLAARFDDQHAVPAVLGETIGEHAAGTPRADHDEVVFPERLHRRTMLAGKTPENVYWKAATPGGGAR